MFYVGGFVEGTAAASGASAACAGEPRAYVQLNLTFQAFPETAMSKGDTRVLDKPTPILLARFMSERGLCIGSRDDVAAAPDGALRAKALGR